LPTNDTEFRRGGSRRIGWSANRRHASGCRSRRVSAGISTTASSTAVALLRYAIKRVGILHKLRTVAGEEGNASSRGLWLRNGITVIKPGHTKSLANFDARNPVNVGNESRRDDIVALRTRRDRDVKIVVEYGKGSNSPVRSKGGELAVCGKHGGKWHVAETSHILNTRCAKPKPCKSYSSDPDAIWNV
jgi:hypothetical protein